MMSLQAYLAFLAACDRVTTSPQVLGILGRGRALSLSDLNFGAYQVTVPAAAGRATAFDELSGRLSLRHFDSQWSLPRSIKKAASKPPFFNPRILARPSG